MEYYTTREAMAVLDVTKVGLLYMIKKFSIRTKRIEHWNRLMVSRTDVDKLKDRPRRRRRSPTAVTVTRKTKQGYYERYHPTHLHANTSGYVPEHKLVMEAELGRALKPDEVVHHIDGDRTNNHPNNLRVYENQNEHIRLGHSLDAFWRKWCSRFVMKGTTKGLEKQFITELRSQVSGLLTD